MKTAEQTVAELGEMIAHMRWRPGMHFGDPSAPGAPLVHEIGFWHMFRMWAWIQDRSEELKAAERQASKKLKIPGGLTASNPHSVPESMTTEKHCQFVLHYWDEVACILGLDISEEVARK